MHEAANGEFLATGQAGRDVKRDASQEQRAIEK
jgi:hypothetical protein